MTTLLSWGNRSGKRGRCDARCHNAKGTACSCMCGGRYHGARALVARIVLEAGHEILAEARRRAAKAGFALQGGTRAPVFGWLGPLFTTRRRRRRRSA